MSGKGGKVAFKSARRLLEGHGANWPINLIYMGFPQPDRAIGPGIKPAFSTPIWQEESIFVEMVPDVLKNSYCTILHLCV
jgi:hypothetical protein